MSDFIDKVVDGKYYLLVQDEISLTWGGSIYEYSWDCYLSTKKQLMNIKKEQDKEGWIRLNSIKAIKKSKDSWLCYAKGTANGGLPLDHRGILKSISKVIEKK